VLSVADAGLQVNPWCYSQSACKRLYEMSLDMISEVESEINQSATQKTQLAGQTAAAPAANGSNSTGSVNGAGPQGVKHATYDDAHHANVKQQQQALAPMGVEEVYTVLSAEALPLKGS
jgi:hypothetical protein